MISTIVGRSLPKAVVITEYIRRNLRIFQRLKLGSAKNFFKLGFLSHVVSLNRTPRLDWNKLVKEELPTHHYIVPKYAFLSHVSESDLFHSYLLLEHTENMNQGQGVGAG